MVMKTKDEEEDEKDEKKRKIKRHFEAERGAFVDGEVGCGWC